MSTLSIRDLHAAVDGHEILRGIDLEIASGQVHALMGPNGSGKSTLAHALMGRDDYEVSSGSVTIDGVELLALPTWQRAEHGLFVAMQYPVEVAGVRVRDLVGAAIDARGGSSDGLDAAIEQEAERLGVAPQFLARGVNVEFSGGEQKRVETLQLAVLDPRFAVLDEIDSGLDIDALGQVARRIEQLTEEASLGVLAITHYARLLTELRPDRVHMLMGGRIVASGGPELADRLEVAGYDGLATELGVDLTVEVSTEEADPFKDPTLDNSPFADPLA